VVDVCHAGSTVPPRAITIERSPQTGTSTKMSDVPALDTAIDEATANGARLKWRTSDEAVIAYGAGNVLLHLTFAALTVVVSGLFVFPWIVWANTVRERRVTLHVDATGHVIRAQAR
jgi:hypothetical protein